MRRPTEALQDEPSRFLRDADFLAELHAADALARGNEEIHRVEPFIQRYMRALEDGPRANREILFARVAAIVAAFADSDALAARADWTLNAVRPQTRFEIDPRRFRIGKELKKLKRADGYVVHLFSPFEPRPC